MYMLVSRLININIWMGQIVNYVIGSDYLTLKLTLNIDSFHPNLYMER